MDMAILRLAHVVQSDPDNRNALECLCDALRAQGHLETVAGLLEWWASATTDKSSAAGALTEASTIRERLGQSAEYALTLLRRALRIEPTHGAALRRLAAILKSRGDHARLLSILTAHLSELRGAPEHSKARAYFARELAHVHQRHTGNLDAAVEALEEAAMSAPLDRRIALELARAYASRAKQTRKPEQAREDRKLAVRLLCQIAEIARPNAARAMALEALDACPQSIDALCIYERHARPQDRSELCTRYEAFLEVGPSAYGHRVRQRLIDTLLERGEYDAATSQVRSLPPRVGALDVDGDVVRACSVPPPPPELHLLHDTDLTWEDEEADCYAIDLPSEQTARYQADCTTPNGLYLLALHAK